MVKCYRWSSATDGQTLIAKWCNGQTIRCSNGSDGQMLQWSNGAIVKCQWSNSAIVKQCNGQTVQWSNSAIVTYRWSNANGQIVQ